MNHNILLTGNHGHIYHYLHLVHTLSVLITFQDPDLYNNTTDFDFEPIPLNWTSWPYGPEPVPHWDRSDYDDLSDISRC